MTYAVVYSSRTGNTRLLAETIREQLPAGDCLYFGAPSPEALKAEMIFCGFWTDKGTCDENVASFLGSLKQQRVFLFGTAGFGGDPAYFEKILNTVKQCLSPSVSLCGGFLCQGKMPEGVAPPCWKTLTVPCLIPTHRTWNPCAPPSAKRSRRTHKARFLSPKGRRTVY